MTSYRFSLPRMLVLLRIGFNELRDDVSRWLEARRQPPRVADYDPDTDLCGQFAECLRRNGFEEQADSVWKIGSSDHWEDHAHAFAKAMIESGDKEAARIGVELLSDCLEHFASTTTAKAVAKVKLDVFSLRSALGDVPRSATSWKRPTN